MSIDKSNAIAPIDELRDVLAPYPADRYWHLIPTQVTERSSLYRPTLSVVQVNPDDSREVYPTPGGGGTLCLHSQALERIGNAAGIDFDPRLSKHVHDVKNEPLICEQHVGGYYTDGLGMRRRITASAKSDLRDGSITARILGKGADTARQFICERTESRARNRAIRKTTNLPSSFTKKELTLPMVAVRYRLDERHPDVRAALIQAGTAAADQVFGRGEGAALDAGMDTPEDEVRTTTIDVTPEPEIPDTAPAAAPAAAAPKPPDPIDAIAARVANDLRKRPAQEKDTPASDDDIRALGIALRDALALKQRQIPQPRWKDIRLAIARILYGVNNTRDLNAAQVRVLTDMARDPQGQQALIAVFMHALVTVENMADLRDLVGGR